MNKKIICIICMLTMVNTLPMVSGIVNNPNYEMTISVNSEIDWWPMFRHDLGHSGFSTSDAPETANLKWSDSYVSDSAIDFEPLVVDDRVYISPASIHFPGTGSFFCLDANDGSTIWNVPDLGECGLVGSAIGEDRIYISGTDEFFRATIWCFDLETGNQIWSHSFLGSFFSAPFAPMHYDGKLYFIWIDLTMGGDYTYHIRCVKDHGAYALVKWDRVIDNIMINDYRYIPNLVPAIADGKVYAISDYKIYRFDANTGIKDWEKQRSKLSDLSLAVVDEKIYFGEQGYVICLNANDGSEAWSKRLDSNPRVVLSPSVADGKVYAGFIKDGYSTYVYCLDSENNGDTLWSKHLFDSTNQYTYVSPTAVADDKIYIAGGEFFDWGEAYCLDADDGSIIWNYSIDGSVIASPSIANGALYIGTRSGTLYKFEDVYQNHPPYPPVITGETNGKIGTEYSYTFVSVDQDGDDISCYTIDWGDNSGDDVVTGPFASGEVVTVAHTWSEKGTYTIKAKAKDTNNLESDWETFKVIITRAKTTHNTLLLRLLERLPNAFPILRQLLKL